MDRVIWLLNDSRANCFSLGLFFLFLLQFFGYLLTFPLFFFGNSSLSRQHN